MREQSSQEIAFLEEVVVKASFINKDAKEYNKQLFVGPSSIGGYTWIKFEFYL